MNKLLILLVVFHVVLGLQATMNNALRTQVIIAFKDILVPVISKEIKTITANGTKGKSDNYKYSLNSIDFKIDHITPYQVKITIHNDSTIEIKGISPFMNESTDGWVDYEDTIRNFKVEITIGEFAFSMKAFLKSVDNKLSIEIQEMSLDLSYGHVHAVFKTKIFEQIESDFRRLVELYIVSNLTSAIKDRIPSEATRIVNNLFNSLSTDINITDQVYLKYQFSAAPVKENESMATGIVAYFHTFNNFTPSPGPVSPMPLFDETSPTSVQFFMSDYVVRSAIDTLFKLDLMKILVKREIGDHMVNLSCMASELPGFRFANAIEANVTGACSFTLDNSSEPNIRVFASLHLRLSEKIRQAALFFNVETFTFFRLSLEVLTPVDLQWFNEAIDKIFGVIIEEVNVILEKAGIPFPWSDKGYYGHFIQRAGDGYMMLGTNFIFPEKRRDIDEKESEQAIENWELTED
eukprot:TRINITY_DN10645_c0_g1_i7.p1 TRINITY_DN10645_c0_g1~~TRINITY_DN10645_c0_g1_i7.p1  ORF type:complete len:464 (-),score=76.21 TRINITY_DN10645_c0_g1_i7:119-1510(-)